MTNERTRGLAPLLLLPLVAVLIAAPSCIFDPEKADEPTPGPVLEWPDRTSRDDCIETIRVAYQLKEMGTYDELLHPDFIWDLQEADALKFGIEFWDKATELQLTERLFNGAITLELTIEKGETQWTPISSVGDEPCVDCYSTIKDYYISAKLDPNEATLQGDAKVQFIVAPDTDEEGKWQIKYMYDLPQ